jgi:hypothetical protein
MPALVASQRPDWLPPGASRAADDSGAVGIRSERALIG